MRGKAVHADSIKSRVESAWWFQRLKLQYDETLSNFALNSDLRRYSEAWSAGWYATVSQTPDVYAVVAGRCRLSR